MSRLGAILMLLLYAGACPAGSEDPDVVIDFKGEAIPARILRFEDNVFTIATSNGVRELPVEEVTTVFFDINGPMETAAPVAAPPQASAPIEAPPPRPDPVPAAAPPVAAISNAPVPSPRIGPPYGQPAASLLATDLRVQGQALLGRVVKVEFHSRGGMVSAPDGSIMVQLNCVNDWYPLPINAEASTLDWFRQLPTTPSFLDLGRRKARGFYLYGVVIETPAAWGTQFPQAAMSLQMNRFTIQPIGRKTQRGVRGAVDYGW